jgi:hypothetical protein
MKILLALNRSTERLVMVINALDSVDARHLKPTEVFTPVKSILNLLAIKNKVNLVMI